MVITHGDCLVQHTTLADYVFTETNTASDFGKLLMEVEKKIIMVENSDKTVYSREQQRQQIIRMIAANVNGVYTNDAFREVTQYSVSHHSVSRKVIVAENSEKIVYGGEQQIIRMTPTNMTVVYTTKSKGGQYLNY